MNILKRFARNANKATATEVELFYDQTTNGISYLDNNGKPVKLLTKTEDSPSDKCTILIRTDGIKVNQITAQNSLNTSDYSFNLQVQTTGGKTPATQFTLKNTRGGRVFSDMNITKINFDHLFIGGIELHVNWSIEGDALIFIIKDSVGNFVFKKGTIISIWLEIEVFKNAESQVLRVISRKEKEEEKK